MVASPLGPQGMKTYQVTTSFRRATCEEVDCPQYQRGWVTVVDESTDLGRRQAAYIRQECRPENVTIVGGTVRRYRESCNATGGTEFTFGPGQRCFGRHEVPLVESERFLVRDGDRRAYLGRPYRHREPDHWVEDMQTNFDGIRRVVEKG
jgi:hypothetical protein